MKLSAKLKAHVLSEKWAEADADDKVIVKAIGDHLSDGSLSATQFLDLSEDEGNSKDKKRKDFADTIVKRLKEGMVVSKEGETTKEKEELNKTKAHQADASPDIAGMVKSGIDEALAARGLKIPDNGDGPVQMLSKAAMALGGTHIHVHAAHERYGDTKLAAVFPKYTTKNAPHPLADQPARWMGRQLYHPSDLDKALTQAWFKYDLAANHTREDIPRGLRMNEHDRELVRYALHHKEFNGYIGESSDGEFYQHRVDRERLTPMQIKAVLDDTTSGGQYLAPAVFDDSLIITPVLESELLPYVNVINLNRGSRVTGAKMGVPTMSWSSPEGTAISPFTTTGFISPFNTTIFTVTAGMEVGMDMEEDTSVNLGDWIMKSFGPAFRKELDYVIAMGNGTTQPLGIINTVGPNTAEADNPTDGPVTVGDLEALMAAMPPEYRRESGARLAWLSNDGMYWKARSIPIGPYDERRVFGMDHASYRVFDTPWRIQQDVPDGTIALVNLARYRLYRRLGMQTRVETGGQYLALRNLKLIIVRGRFGGQMETAGAVSIMDDAQSV